MQATVNGYHESSSASSILDSELEQPLAELPADLLPNGVSKASQTGEAEPKRVSNHPLSFLGDDPEAVLSQGFHNPAMNKMFQDLEKSLMESTKGIDEMNKRMELERKQQERERDTAHVPAPLKNEGRSLDTLLEDVCVQLFRANYSGDLPRHQLLPRRPKLRQLDQRAYTVLSCHSLAAWLSSGGGGASGHVGEDGDKFVRRMHADLTEWIPKVWRLGAGELVFHMDKWDGLVLACRRALLVRYPTLLDCGFECLFSKPPVVYLHPTAPRHLLDYMATQLCLPRTCFRMVPGCAHNSDCMDHVELARLVQEDTGEGRTPLFVYAVCGSRATGSFDRLGRVAAVCRQHRLWMHVQGMKLSQLALNSVPTSLRALLGGSSTVSSCLLEFDQWLGHPGLINATVLRTARDGKVLHQTSEDPNAPMTRKAAAEAAAAVASESSLDSDPDWSPPPPADLRCLSYQPMWLLPLWFALQSMGYDNIQARVRSAEQTVKRFAEALKSVPDIELIELPSLSEDDKADIKANTNLLGQLLSFLIDFETTPPVLLFRFCPPELRSLATQPTAGSESASGKAELTAPYAVRGEPADSEPDAATAKSAVDSDAVNERAQLLDQLSGVNRWLAESLRSAVPHLQFSLLESPPPPLLGACVRFCPLESCADWCPEQLDGLPEALAESARLLDSTRRARPEFMRLAGACGGRLRYVAMPGWPGLGGLRYVCQLDVSAAAAGAAEPGGEAEESEEDAVNRALAEAVRADDDGFGWCESAGGCVRCGLVPEDVDLPTLVRRVLEAGGAAEAARRQSLQLDDLVRRRIREAEEAIRLDQQRRLVEEGALRQVPFLDSVVNWFSPQPAGGSRATPGTAFSLQSGRLSSTELTYKYKMQVNGD